MFEKEKVMELKILNKQDQSMKAIARVSCAPRNTVRGYVRDSATALHKARAHRHLSCASRLSPACRRKSSLRR